MRVWSLIHSVVIAVSLAVAAGACGSDDPGTVTLVTHDAFAVSEGIFDEFEAETGIRVEVVTTADTGTMVSEAILTAGDPIGDVLFGIDNTFLRRGLDADLFVPYAAAGLADIADELKLDSDARVTPIDVSDVCVNYWTDELEQPPRSLDDLAEPEFAGTFVTQNPETSSPGFAFLLATIVTYGEDGWEDYWARLRDNRVAITPGWTEAYYGSFIAGGGDRPFVTSYATSPVAEVLFADPPIDAPPTGVLVDSCFRQIEFAGILRGTDNEAGARRLVDFLISDTFQEDMPLNMFVFPASTRAAVPAEFEAYSTVAAAPLTLAPDVIEANRAAWTERWTEIVLR